MKQKNRRMTPRGRWIDDPLTVVTRPFGAPGPSYALGWHTGVDLAVPGKHHLPVVWALVGDGRVMANSWDNDYGRYLIIRGRNGNDWLFAHLAQTKVYQGQIVGNGDLIGITGDSGNATGDHLHVERATGTWRFGSVCRPLVYDYSQ